MMMQKNVGSEECGKKVNNGLPFQQLRISVRLPRKVTPNNFPLVLDTRKSDLLKLLLPLCKAKIEPEKRCWTLKYSGRAIFFPSSEFKPVLLLDGRLHPLERWVHVEIINEIPADARPKCPNGCAGKTLKTN